MTTRRVLVCAYPVGYGPAAKALVLGAECRAAGLDAVFVGQGGAHELVARSEGIFQEVVRARAGDEVARTLARESGAVLSVMDRDFASLAGELSRPLCIVDSLLWMRDRVPEEFASARRYWAQDFIGVREPVEGLASQPTVVGPILGPRSVARVTGSGKLVVSLGGFEAAGDLDRDRRYGELVLEAIAGSRLATEFTGRITILAATRTVHDLERLAAEYGIELASLPHEAALDELTNASMVLAAPGLTTVLECFQLGRPTFFLPPRNYSQWCTLKVLRARGLAPHALHWEDCAEEYRLGERLPEAERNPRVRVAIDELVGSRQAREALSRCLSESLDIDSTVLAGHQHEFFRSLGTNGAPVIAAQLIAELEG